MSDGVLAYFAARTAAELLGLQQTGPEPSTHELKSYVAGHAKMTYADASYSANHMRFEGVRSA